MTALLKIITNIVVETPASFIKVDVDPSATRLALINRKTIKVMHTQKLNENKVVGVILPAKFSTEPVLSCIIFDDNLVNDAKIVDNVQSQLIDLSNFNLADA